MKLRFKRGDAIAVISNAAAELGNVEIKCNDALLGSLLTVNINERLVFTGDVLPESERDFYLEDEDGRLIKQAHTDEYLLHVAAQLSQLGYKVEMLR